MAAHRRVWVATIDGRLAGVVVRKDEDHAAAGTQFVGSKILKIATFKVHPDFRGERLGELLLKQILWFAQRNGYDLVYLTAYPDQTVLVRVLEFFGFQHTKSKDDGERFYEKQILHTRLEPSGALDKFTLARLNYPRFIADPPANIFCVPIQGDYHRKLFPEMAIAQSLPLFPGETRFLTTRGDRTPGNTIRKVYLCRSNTRRMDAGDVLLFYHSKDQRLRGSQSLTTVGVLEALHETSNLDELIRLTAKRSVFSESELVEMVERSRSPVRVIDFLLVGHIEPPIALAELLASGVFKGHPPQAISHLDTDRFETVRTRLKFGFDI